MTEKRTKKTNRRLIPRLTAAMATLIALAAPAATAEAATKTVAVGTRTGTSTFVPVCMNWQDSWSECVYTADMLGDIPAGSRILSVGFMGVSGADVEGMDYRLYAAHTDASAAPAEKSALDGFTCLYDGKASLAKSESSSVMEPLFSETAQNEFVYEGGNLHFVVNAHVPQSASVIFASSQRQGGSSLFISNDAWENTSKYAYNYVPVLSLEIELPAGYVDLQQATVGGSSEYDRYTPLDFTSKGAVSATLYPADLLGIPAGTDIHEMAFRGAVYTTSAGNHAMKVWMKNSDMTGIGSSLPSADDMTLVLDTSFKLDSKVGNINQWTEILRMKLDAPFRYEGGNLLVYIQLDNEATQQVYFCVNKQNSGLSLAGYGSSSAAAASGRPDAAPLPTTAFYYATPVPEEKPQFTLVTDKEPGDYVCVNVYSTAGIKIDWGEGNFKEYPWGGNIAANHNILAKEIKVYPLEGSEIQILLCAGHQITSATIDCPTLQGLNLKNNKIQEIDLSGCPALQELNLSGNRFFEFSLSSDVLRSLTLSHCSMEKLDIAGCTALRHLDVSVNALRYPIWLFWPQAPELEHVNVSFNRLLNFDLAGYPKLKTLVCNHNDISSLELAAVPQLETLRAGYTAATKLGLAVCPKLKVIDLYGLQIGDNVNLTRNTALEELDLSLTGATKVNLAANTRLRRLALARNSISSLDLSANKLIEHLDVSRNALSEIDLKPLSALRFLDVSRNALSSLDVSSADGLDSLYCAINNIPALSLPKGNKIRFLDFSSNIVKEMPSEIASIVYLNCADNRIESTDFSRSPSLQGLDIHANLLGKEALGKMFSQLPDINGIDVWEEDAWWKAVLNYSDNPGTPDVSSEVPEAKGWNCSYKADFRGDASAAIVVPKDKVYTRFSFAIDTKDPVYWVDWGDGNKEEFRTENPEYSYNSIAGYALGQVIRIYAPSAVELGIANAAYENVDVAGMPMLRRLSCSGNNFASLDLSANKALEDLNCRANPITSLVFPEDCALTKLDCSLTLLRSIDLSRTPRLKTLSINSCRLEDIDLSPVPGLTQLDAYKNEIRSIDLSQAPALTDVILSDNKLSGLDLAANASIVNLYVDYNEIEELDLSGLKSLSMAHVNHNRLGSLRLDNPSLIILLAGTNQLEEADLSLCPALKTVTLNQNRLSSLDLAANSALQQVFAGENAIREVKLPESAPDLKVINLSQNKISEIDMKAVPALNELVISNNLFAGTLDISGNPAITLLNFSHNMIESVKWCPSSEIVTIFGSHNRLKTLNVPGSKLGYVDCSRNQIEAVNFSNHKNLNNCILDFNRLASVNLKANTNLWGVSLRANILEAAAIGQICSQLPDVWSVELIPGHENWMKTIFLSGNPGCASADVTAAVDKGWTVVMDETMPEDRVLRITVSDPDGLPVAGASLTLLVASQDVATPCVEAAEGVYVYDPLPVFSGLDYAVRIAKEGFVTKTVDVNAVRDGDLDLDVTLARLNGVEGIEAGDDGGCEAEYYDLQGIRLSAPAKGSIVIVRKGGRSSLTMIR